MNKKRATTIQYQGKEYAMVKDRMLEFRTANPRGLIETTPTFQSDGTLMFKARIVKDKSDAASAEATGHAHGDSKDKKAFEKLETIAVGRALAFLGYGADGGIASSEEMEEFEEHQQHMKSELILTMTERLEGSTSVEELKDAWASVPPEVKPDLEAIKNAMKAKLDTPDVPIAPPTPVSAAPVKRTKKTDKAPGTTGSLV